MSSASAGRFAAAFSACAPVFRAEAPFAGAPPGNGFTALRLRTKRSAPCKRRKAQRKALNCAPRKAPRRAPKRQSWAALQQADSPQSFPHAPRFAAAFSACAPIFRAEAPFAGARRPGMVSPLGNKSQPQIKTGKSPAKGGKHREKRRDALRNGSHGQRFSGPIRRSLFRMRPGFPRRRAHRQAAVHCRADAHRPNANA